jgi:hypothetical protein
MKANKEKTIFYFEKDPGYDILKKITQGWFTMLNTTDNLTIVINEQGEYKLPINNQATKMFGIKLYGNVAIIGKLKRKPPYFLS